MAETFLYLTTTGWKTGRQHQIEIWFVEHAGCWYLCAEHGESAHWVRNIQHQPAVQFSLGTQPDTPERPAAAGRARTVDATKEEALAKVLAQRFEAKYNWSDGLFIEICAV